MCPYNKAPSYWTSYIDLSETKDSNDLMSGATKVHKAMTKTYEVYNELCEVMKDLNNQICFPSQPCTCQIKETQVNGMGLIYYKRECPTHGKLWKVQ